MAVEAANPTTLTLSASQVRYSIRIHKASGRYAAYLTLQRSQRREDGVWLDDPTPGSRRSVVTHALAVVLGQFDPLAASLAAIAGATAPAGDYVLRLNGRLDASGKLDVEVVGAFGTLAQPQRLGLLSEILAGHPELAVPASQAWASLDAAVTALNAAERWV